MYSILAIDGSSYHLRVIKDMLSGCYHVFPAISGDIAFRYLKRRRPDLILLDTAMPGMDGWEIMRKLKSDPRYSSITVIFLTARSDKETETECLRLGACDFITKPVAREVLISRVGKALEAEICSRKLQLKLEEKTKELEAISLASINAMAALIDARDTYTKGHSVRVADYSVKIAGNMGWNEKDTRSLYEIALLHDVGKIGVPDEILLKPTALTEEEMEIMKNHTVIGADILKEITAIKDLELGARYHHERFDGKGYPEGLKGTEIPVLARIICVADSFDAMCSNRCYRSRLSNDRIRQEMLRGSGKQFDPEVVFAFLKSWDEIFTIESGRKKNG
ncbi:HD domain-containing phosphohydrolase [Lachnospiraceae bacterium 54-53]